jgi:hypothetical protein
MRSKRIRHLDRLRVLFVDGNQSFPMAACHGDGEETLEQLTKRTDLAALDVRHQLRVENFLDAYAIRVSDLGKNRRQYDCL